jgi:hypothetical protein
MPWSSKQQLSIKYEVAVWSAATSAHGVGIADDIGERERRDGHDPSAPNLASLA